MCRQPLTLIQDSLRRCSTVAALRQNAPQKGMHGNATQDIDLQVALATLVAGAGGQPKLTITARGHALENHCAMDIALSKLQAAQPFDDLQAMKRAEHTCVPCSRIVHCP